MYKKYFVFLALVVSAHVFCAERAQKRASLCDKHRLEKSEATQRYNRIVDAPHFYDLAKKIFENEKSSLKDIEEEFLALYKNHYHDWLTHQSQMRAMAQVAAQRMQQKYASEQSPCVIL